MARGPKIAIREREPVETPGVPDERESGIVRKAKVVLPDEKTRTNTLRVRLTPYARQHAKADGATEDTPASVLLYSSLLGSFDRVVSPCWSTRQTASAPLDPAAAFVLSRIDGTIDIDTLLELCPMPAHVAMRTLLCLVALGAVELVDRRSSPGEGDAG